MNIHRANSRVLSLHVKSDCAQSITPKLSVWPAWICKHPHSNPIVTKVGYHLGVPELRSSRASYTTSFDSSSHAPIFYSPNQVDPSLPNSLPPLDCAPICFPHNQTIQPGKHPRILEVTPIDKKRGSIVERREGRFTCPKWVAQKEWRKSSGTAYDSHAGLRSNKHARRPEIIAPAAGTFHWYSSEWSCNSKKRNQRNLRRRDDDFPKAP